MDALADGRGLALIGELLIKSSAVLAAAILGAVGLRGRSSFLRHYWLSVCLVGLGFLPALSLFSAGWSAPWLPDRGSRETAPQAGPAAAGGASPGMIAVRPEAGTGMASSALLRAGATDRDHGSSGYRKALGYVLPALWLAGLVLMLARLAAGLGRIRRITRESEVLDDPGWKRLLQSFVSAVPLRRGVGLKAHPRVVVPLTWGFRRPVVIMPGGTGAWTDEARGSALFHELSHVKRGDFLVMLCVRLSLAVFWLNPLFWVAFRMLKNEQEKACDELVIKAGIRPSTYADNLLSFIRSVRPARSPLAAFPGVLGMFGRSQLRERLLLILGRKTVFKEVAMKTKVTVSVVVFLAVAFIGLARPERAAAVPGARAAAADAAITPRPAVPQETQVKPGGTSAEKPNTGETKPADVQEKEKKVRKEIKVVLDGRDTGAEPVEITVIDGTSRKEIKLDGSVLILKKGKDGRTALLTPEGKEIAIVGGDGTRLEIKAGRLMLLKEGKKLDPVNEPEVFTVIEDDKLTGAVPDEGRTARTVIVKTRPRREVVVEDDETGPVEIERLEKGDGEVVVTKRRLVRGTELEAEAREEELQARLAETQALLKKIEALNLAESDLKARQKAIQTLEESLADLQKELEKKEESLDALRDKRKTRVDVEVRESEPREEVREKAFMTMRDEGAAAIRLDLELKGDSKEAYEKAVAGLKEGLPPGTTLESKFDEGTKTIRVKITGPRGNDEDRKNLLRLVEKFTAEPRK